MKLPKMDGFLSLAFVCTSLIFFKRAEVYTRQRSILGLTVAIDCIFLGVRLDVLASVPIDVVMPICDTAPSLPRLRAKTLGMVIS